MQTSDMTNLSLNTLYAARRKSDGWWLIWLDDGAYDWGRELGSGMMANHTKAHVFVKTSGDAHDIIPFAPVDETRRDEQRRIASKLLNELVPELTMSRIAEIVRQLKEGEY